MSSGEAQQRRRLRGGDLEQRAKGHKPIGCELLHIDIPGPFKEQGWKKEEQDHIWV